MCNCHLCVVFWCLVLRICFSFLAAGMLKVFCSFPSRSFTARSLSMTRCSQDAFVGFFRLYWSPRSSNFCSSSVNWMLVRLVVRGKDAVCCFLGFGVGVLNTVALGGLLLFLKCGFNIGVGMHIRKMYISGSVGCGWLRYCGATLSV